MGFLKRRRAASSGVEATATVLEVTTEPYLRTNVHDDLEPVPGVTVVSTIRLRVQPPGGAPYDIELKGGQARAIAEYHRGDGSEIAVRIDPDDPSVVVVDEERAAPAVQADLDMLEAIESGDFELPPESRWPKDE
jgi:hypothetical protein